MHWILDLNYGRWELRREHVCHGRRQCRPSAAKAASARSLTSSSTHETLYNPVNSLALGYQAQTMKVLGVPAIAIVVALTLAVNLVDTRRPPYVSLLLRLLPPAKMLSLIPYCP